MNAFVRSDPYPFFGPFETDLPHVGRYRFDSASAPMLNSGLVAARFEHLPVIEDAIALMDRLWAAKLYRHDIEQFAVGECFRLAGVELALIDREFEHYCSHWAKRYMRRRLRRRLPSAVALPIAARPDIPLSKTRVRLFKGRNLARIGLRKLRRRAAGARPSAEDATRPSVDGDAGGVRGVPRARSANRDQLLPIRTPAASTRPPPSMTLAAAESGGVSM